MIISSNFYRFYITHKIFFFLLIRDASFFSFAFTVAVGNRHNHMDPEAVVLVGLVVAFGRQLVDNPDTLVPVDIVLVALADNLADGSHEVHMYLELLVVCMAGHLVEVDTTEKPVVDTQQVLG